MSRSELSGMVLAAETNTHSVGESCMKNLFNRFVRDEQGQDLIENGLLVGIITVGCLVAIKAIGPKVAGYFTTLNTNLP